MMLLCYHGMVPLQCLCDIGAVTVRFLCNILCVNPIDSPGDITSYDNLRGVKS